MRVASLRHYEPEHAENADFRDYLVSPRLATCCCSEHARSVPPVAAVTFPRLVNSELVVPTDRPTDESSHPPLSAPVSPLNLVLGISAGKYGPVSTAT